MYKKIKPFLALLLCIVFLILCCCTNKKVAPIQPSNNNSNDNTVKINSFEELLNESGLIDLEKLSSVTASVVKTNYDDRVYIQYKNSPYYYNPVYISYDQILNNNLIKQENKFSVLEECFIKAKENGFKTVALYINWQNFFNGQTYDFDFYKIYYDLAEKHDLNIALIWNGYAKSGFMPWQTDREKYPALNETGNIPDFSNKIYCEEAIEAIGQFCAWLNFYDKNCRTLLFQIEDEANTNIGLRAWFSQYNQFSNLIFEMAKAFKQSSYRAVTTVGLNFNDYYTTIDGITGQKRYDSILNNQNIDGYGAAHLNPDKFLLGMLSSEQKFCYISKISPSTYTFFVNALNFITKGVQFGVYELKSFDIAINSGMYRTHSTRWDVRNKQVVDRGIMGNKRLLEAATVDVCDFIKGINSLGEILATNNTNDILVINPNLCNQYYYTGKFGDITINFNNAEIEQFTYNSAGLCVIDPFSQYYIFTFHSTPFFAVDDFSKLKLSSGSFMNSSWQTTGENCAKNSRFVLKSGVAYKLIF